MGQLFDAFGIQTHLLIAQAVNFGVLFVGLTYLLYKPVLKTLEERRVVVAKGVEDAKAAELALAEADTRAGEIARTAETEAEALVQRARTTASEEHDRLVDAARQRAEGIEKDAHLRAQEAHEKVLRESEKEIARLAILAAEKTLRAGKV